LTVTENGSNYFTQNQQDLNRPFCTNP